MADKVKGLEERLDRLESRLKTTFLEVERRLETTKVEEPAIISVEERLQEIEDLILLLQLEITKIKEKTGGEEFIAVAAQPDLEERMKKMEEALSVPAAAVSAAKPYPAGRLLEGKIERLESKIEELEEKHGRASSPFSASGALDEIERRLDRLEESRERPKYSVAATVSGSLMQDVKHILES